VFELKAYTLSHSTSPFLWFFFFLDRVWRTLCPGLALNHILLISDSWIASITSISPWCLAKNDYNHIYSLFKYSDWCFTPWTIPPALFFLFFWVKVSPFGPVWPQTYDLPSFVFCLCWDYRYEHHLAFSDIFIFGEVQLCLGKMSKFTLPNTTIIFPDIFF
jgi:hypothetical protein